MINAIATPITYAPVCFMAGSNAKVERRGTATRLALYSWRVRSKAC
jgi:hypothetical protein